MIKLGTEKSAGGRQWVKAGEYPDPEIQKRVNRIARRLGWDFHWRGSALFVRFEGFRSLAEPFQEIQRRLHQAG